jgi:hypothetical protein
MAGIKLKTGFLGWIIAVYVVAWCVQDKLALSWDVDWLIHSARLAMVGKTYSQDFFTPNQPLILLLYLPPVLFSKWLGLKIMLPFRVYMFSLATLSWLMCAAIVKNIFTPADNTFARFFLILLSMGFILYPLGQLGQRDYLLLVFGMPYFLVLIQRMQSRLPVKTSFAVWIGVVAGLGIALKPQFLAVPILLESYLMVRQKNILSWWRPEILSMLVLFIINAFVILIYFPDFIFVVLPLVMHNYYVTVGIPFKQLVMFAPAVYSLAPLLVFLIYREKSCQTFFTVMIIVLLGLLISYYAQHTLFYYHILPAFTLATMLMFLLYSNIIRKVSLRTTDYLQLFSLSLIPCYLTHQFRSQILLFEPLEFYVSAALLFIVVMCFTRRKISFRIIIANTLVILALGYAAQYFSLISDAYTHRSMITLVTMLVVFGLLTAKTAKDFIRQIFILCVGAAIFNFPLEYNYFLFNSAESFKQVTLNTLIAFMQTQPPAQRIYALSTSVYVGSPLLDYTDAQLVQSYDCLWQTTDLARREKLFGLATLGDYIQHNHDPTFFLNHVADDFIKSRPDLVFVDIKPINMQVDGVSSHFDFLKAFLLSPRFRQEWRHYEYLTTLSAGDFFGSQVKLEVYKRRPNQ